MNPYTITFENWNKLGEIYQEKFMDFDLYNDTYDAFCDAVAVENAQILDLGCGPGNISKYLLSKRPDFQITAIDVAPKMIELAKKNNPTAKFELMDVRDLEKLKNRKFDGIISGFCLPYLSAADAKKLMAKCAQLFTQKGVIYLSFMEGNPEDSGYIKGSTGDKVYFYYHELDELKKILKNNNFSDFSIYKKDFFKADGGKEVHSIVLARKKDF